MILTTPDFYTYQGYAESNLGAGAARPILSPSRRRRGSSLAACFKARANPGFGAEPHSFGRIPLKARLVWGSGRSPILSAEFRQRQGWSGVRGGAPFFRPNSAKGKAGPGFGAEPHSFGRIPPKARLLRGSGRSPVLFNPGPSRRELRQDHSFQGSCGGMPSDHLSLIPESHSISAFDGRRVHANLPPTDRISAANHMAAS